MEKTIERSLTALLNQFGLEAKEGDLDRFGDVLETYVASLKGLHSFDLGDEEIAPTFDPQIKK
jgi:hypothetical protein